SSLETGYAWACPDGAPRARSSHGMAPTCLWAADETVTTRAGALRSSSPCSKLVSRNGPRWLVAKVVSSPLAVSWRRGEITPALLTRTSSRPRGPSRSAVSLPIPLVAPVTRQVVPDIAPTRPPVLVTCTLQTVSGGRLVVRSRGGPR